MFQNFQTLIMKLLWNLLKLKYIFTEYLLTDAVDAIDEKYSLLILKNYAKQQKLNRHNLKEI